MMLTNHDADQGRCYEMPITWSESGYDPQYSIVRRIRP